MNVDTIQEIKLWRIRHGISQRALATKAGYSRNTYAAWETKRRAISQTALWKLQNTIFAWGENDYIINTNIQTEHLPAEPEHKKTKKKKSLLWYIRYYIRKSIRFVLRTLCIIK